ncbi:MAG: hypothetical protein IPL61_37285 [Myxococcales bacterium]|nr:hypothetical protein [Myxococcales bacterium]
MGLALAAAGCGDNNDLGGPDAGAPDASAAGPTAYAVSGDFATTGVFSAIDVAAGTVRANALAGVAGGDPFLRRIGDEVMIVNRDRGENVTVLGGAPLALVDQYGTGGGSNPQDVAAANGKLYVPALGGAGVVVIDRATRALTTIAIAGDPDGKPDCVSAYAVGAQVVVVCGLLDGTFTPRGPGLVAVIDSATDTVTTTFPLADQNPVGLLVRAPGDGDLLIGTAPSFSDFTTGCIARVTPGPTPHASGCLVTNAALGGLANHLDVAPDGSAIWVAVTGFTPDFSSQFGRLHALDLTTGAPRAVTSKMTQRIDDVAACADGYVIGADGTMGASGVRIWKDGVETTTAALDIGRPTGFGNNLICR